MTGRTSSQTTIAILEPTPVVGGTLEVLLGGAGYRVLLLSATPANGSLVEVLREIDLVLLGSSVANGLREAFLRAMASSLETATIPVLALSPGAKGTLAEEDRLVPWPSRIEDLSRAIEAAVSANGHLGGAQDQR